jgi:hypothetical protein
MVFVIGFGGLVSFWLISAHMQFRARGYRIRWVEANERLYEERGVSGQARLN